MKRTFSDCLIRRTPVLTPRRMVIAHTAFCLHCFRLWWWKRKRFLTRTGDFVPALGTRAKNTRPKRAPLTPFVLRAKPPVRHPSSPTAIIRIDVVRVRRKIIEPDKMTASVSSRVRHFDVKSDPMGRVDALLTTTNNRCRLYVVRN